eukprot:GHVR01133305.1.p1 GENE.GHVR01133305.1~~GHVR01133305.1.p1  ORF type:complete len:180 (+),score=19.63 GHVR01133305.1:3-542(+)
MVPMRTRAADEVEIMVRRCTNCLQGKYEDMTSFMKSGGWKRDRSDKPWIPSNKRTLDDMMSKGLLDATITSSATMPSYDSTTGVNVYAAILGFMQLIGELKGVIESKNNSTSPRLVANHITEALECYWFYSSNYGIRKRPFPRYCKHSSTMPVARSVKKMVQNMGTHTVTQTHPTTTTT